MIPRILVPRDVRPAADRADAPPPRRLTTLLDERTVVAANLPRTDLQTHSDIPSHMPLDVLASRVVVPEIRRLRRLLPIWFIQAMRP